MSINIDPFEFLIKQKPICTQNPIKHSISNFKELRAKYKQEMGMDLLDDRCPNSFNCLISGEGCIGRPFPIDPVIHQALSNLNVTISKGSYKHKEVYLAKATVECSECPLFNQCESTCASQESYLKRSIKPDLSPRGPMLVNIDDYEKGYYGSRLEEPEMEDLYDEESWKYESLPLDCLTSRQREIWDMNFHQGLSQVTIAYKLKISQKVVSEHISSAVNKLTEVGRARKLIQESSEEVPDIIKLYYLNNMTQSLIATLLDLQQYQISRIISDWKQNNSL